MPKPPAASPGHAFAAWRAREAEGLVLRSRRSLLKAGLMGVAGLSLPTLLRSRAEAARNGQGTRRKSVILLWMAGGPSHIDTWDPKPKAPDEVPGLQPKIGPPGLAWGSGQATISIDDANKDDLHR